ncbi:MAG: SEC-C metal-binding domain-containing protein [Leptospirales bacterium]
MGAEIGRNDPCPCGSGKKYKKCCLPRGDLWRDLELRRQKIRTFLLDLSRDKDLRSPLYPLDLDLVAKGWKDFFHEKAWREVDKTSENFQLFFLPWFLYRWYPGWLSDRKGEKEGGKTGGLSQIRNYLEKKGSLLPEDVRTLFTEGPETPLSGFIVRKVWSGGFLAGDLLTQDVHQILDLEASRALLPGDCFFGLVVNLGKFSLIETPAVTVLQPIDGLTFVKLRKVLEKKVGRRLTRRDVDSFEPSLLALYRRILLVSSEEISPENAVARVNTDQEPLLLHTLHYDIASCQSVFDALKHLALVFMTEEEVQDGVSRDAKGRMTGARFRWFKAGNAMHPTWTNTVMGAITLTENALDVEVNSKRRAEIFQTIAEKTLKGLATLSRIDVKEFDTENPVTPAGVRNMAFMNSLPIGLDSPEDSLSPDERSFVLETAFYEHERWLEEPNPHLDGKKPIDVRSDPDYREFLEILLYQKEKDLSGVAPQSAGVIVGHLYEKLGWLTLTPAPRPPAESSR